MRLLSCLVLCLTWHSLPGARGATFPWTPARYPNPTVDVGLCGRGKPSWICDPDHVLSTNGANVVEGVIKLIASGEAPYVQQPCGPDRRLTGFEVAFALMDKFYSGWGTDLGRTAQKFAASLHDTWGVGDPACQNGVLVLLSVEDRQLYISTGSGSGRWLTEGQLDAIIEDAKPLLRDKRFDEAMQHVAVNIGLALAGHKIEPDRGSDTIVYIVVPLFVIAFVAIAWKSRQDERSTRTRHQRCNSLLERIKRDQDNLNSGAAFAVTSCPICLEEFAVGPPPSAPPMPAEVAAEHTAAYSDSPSAPLLGEVQPPDAGLARRRSPSSSTIYPTVPPATASFGPVEHSVSPPAPVPTTGLADGQAGGSSVAGQAAERGRTPLVAPCGHMFCEPCLASWVLEQRKTSCPICRQNMEGDGAPPGPPPQPRRPCAEQQEDWEREFPQPAAPRVTTRWGWLQRRRHHHHPVTLPLLWRNRFSECSAYLQPSFNPFPAPLNQQERQERLRQDLLFRLAALRRRYPEFVTPEMTRRWGSDIAQGRQLSATTLRNTMLQDPAVTRALAGYGSAGTRSAFGGGGGGGRSSGGRGGSW
ncbi:hypothetical protein V8C86DRAFT_2688347 [Haematococcus lacustris]